MPESLDQVREQISIANRMLANEGILDAFGHVSMRHPTKPDRFFISRHRAPKLVEPVDVLEFTLDAKPVTPTDVRLYGEMVIHSCIYEARPDVNAVCHHHAPTILPYCISGIELKPVYHLGAAMGEHVPFWDSRDEFGDTALVVIKPEEGRSLAKALGNNWTVLMRRHGATVAGIDIQQLVFRTIYACRNAELQSQAHAHGHVGALTPAEAEKAAAYNLRPGPMQRAWDYWMRRLNEVDALNASAKDVRAAPSKGATKTKATRTGKTVKSKAGTAKISRSGKRKGRR
jgi:ribulose-5-phosphate 4-epimerase/fuculose-1-phosphate aldolase